MNILFSIHLFPPQHTCGAEFYAVKIGKEMIKRGHKVRVYLHQWYGVITDPPYAYEGIQVIPPNCSNQAKDELFLWADVVLTHLDFAKWTVWKTRQINKPCYFMVHNTSDFYNDMVNNNDHVKVIYNAHHAKAELNYNKPGFVLPPQVDTERVLTTSSSRKYITLINVNENKGAKQFYEIARQMPDRQFLAVKGSYMEQVLSDLPNVTTWEKQTDISKVYEVTNVLLMPSDYESYGMTASEALANGIPVICSPTPGLKENCGEAAQYVERDNVKKYISLLRQLEKPANYKKWSDAGKQRTKERLPDELFNDLENFLSA